MNTDAAPGAFLEQHAYDRFDRPGSPTRVPFWIVRCDHPSHGPIALNSGRHYDERSRPLTETLQRQHDRDEHGLSIYAIQATYPDGSTRWVTSGDTSPKVAAPYYDYDEAVAAAQLMTLITGKRASGYQPPEPSTTYRVLPHPDPQQGRA